MPTFPSSLARNSPGLLDVALTLGALLGDQLLDLVVLARVERGEGEVLELPLDRVDPEAVRQGSEDLERLARLLLLLLLGERTDRAHVVEAVGQLDQDHPDVGGHRHHHLAVVLGLAFVAALEGDAGELGDAVDELGDLVPEVLAHLLQAGARVLDGVVEERRAEGGGVEPHAGADAGDTERMGDEVLSRLALLAGVALAGEGEGALDLLAIDRLGDVGLVLLDHREQIAQQGALVGGELARDRRPRGECGSCREARLPAYARGDRRRAAGRRPGPPRPSRCSLRRLCLASEESDGLLVPGDAVRVGPRSP